MSRNQLSVFTILLKLVEARLDSICSTWVLIPMLLPSCLHCFEGWKCVTEDRCLLVGKKGVAKKHEEPGNILVSAK